MTLYYIEFNLNIFRFFRLGIIFQFFIHCCAAAVAAAKIDFRLCGSFLSCLETEIEKTDCCVFAAWIARFSKSAIKMTKRPLCSPALHSICPPSFQVVRPNKEHKKVRTTYFVPNNFEFSGKFPSLLCMFDSVCE